MLIPFGVFSAGAGNGAAAGSYDLISSTILTSDQASVTFDVSTYAATYKHLQIRSVAHGSRLSNNSSILLVRFNSDTASNYSYHSLQGNGSAVSSSAASSVGYLEAAVFTGASAANQIQGAMVLDILDAFNTSKYKTTRAFSGENTAEPYVFFRSGNWRSTSAITSITLTDLFGGNLLATSRFSLYGIRG